MATGIWVIAEQKEGKLKKVSLEMLSKAKEMAGGEEVTALMLGSGVEGLAAELGPYGADKVLVFDADVLKDYTTRLYQGHCRCRQGRGSGDSSGPCNGRR